MTDLGDDTSMESSQLMVSMGSSAPAFSDENQDMVVCFLKINLGGLAFVHSYQKQKQCKFSCVADLTSYDLMMLASHFYYLYFFISLTCQ